MGTSVREQRTSALMETGVSFVRRGRSLLGGSLSNPARSAGALLTGCIMDCVVFAEHLLGRVFYGLVLIVQPAKLGEQRP